MRRCRGAVVDCGPREQNTRRPSLASRKTDFSIAILNVDFARPGPPHTRASRCSVACSSRKKRGRISPCRHAAPDSGHGTCQGLFLYISGIRRCPDAAPESITGLALAMLNGHDGEFSSLPAWKAFDFLWITRRAVHARGDRTPDTMRPGRPNKNFGRFRRSSWKGTVTAIATAARKYSIRAAKGHESRSVP